MDIKTAVGIAVVAIICIGIFANNMHNRNSGVLINTPVNAQAAASNKNTTNSSQVLFSSTQYAPYSYAVYPGPISQQAQAALSGFNLTSLTLQNSSTKITLSLIGTGQSQTLTLKPNYRLYIIETTFGDDGYHFDSSLGDDGFVVVTPDGYVTQ